MSGSGRCWWCMITQVSDCGNFAKVKGAFSPGNRGFGRPRWIEVIALTATKRKGIKSLTPSQSAPALL